MKRFSKFIICFAFSITVANAQNPLDLDPMAQLKRLDTCSSFDSEYHIRYSLGVHYLYAGKMQACKSTLISLSAKSESLGRHPGKAYNVLGVLYKRTSKFDSAYYYFKKSEMASRKNKSWKSVGNALTNQCIALLSLDKLDSCYMVLDKVKELLEQDSSLAGVYIASLSLQGNIRLNHSDNSASSLPYYRKVISESKKHNHFDKTATAYASISRYYSENYHLDSAISTLEEGRQLFDSLGDAEMPERKAIILKELANVYSSSEDDRTAIQYAKQVALIETKASNFRHVCDMLDNIATSYSSLYKADKSNPAYYDTAWIYADSAYNLAVKHKIELSKFEANLIRAQLLRRQMENPTLEAPYKASKSLKWMEEASEYIKKRKHRPTDWKPFIVEALRGSLLHSLDRPQQAISVSRPLLRSIDNLELNRLDLKNMIYQTLYNSYKDLGDYENAYEALFQYKKLQDTMYKRDGQKALNLAETKYQTDKIKLENSLLQKESEQKDNLARQERFKRYAWTFLAFGLGLIGLFISLFFRQRKKALEQDFIIEKQQLMNTIDQKENSKLQSILDALEEERKRIAKDLHDRVGSILSTVKLYHNNLLDRMDETDQRMNEISGSITGLLDQSISEVRAVSKNMISGVLADFGLIPAVYDLVESINNSEALRIELSEFGLDARFDKNIEINLYRIIQELFNNTLKHSEATEVELSLNRVDKDISLTYMDNGKGFNVRTQKEGIGLKNMQSRVDKLNGNIRIDSNQNGSTFLFQIPIKNDY